MSERGHFYNTFVVSKVRFDVGVYVTDSCVDLCTLIIAMQPNYSALCCMGGECDELVMVVGHQCITLTGWGTTTTTHVPRLRIGEALENGQEGSTG